MVTWADVILIAPELATASVPWGEQLLADVLAELSLPQLGNTFDRAVKYLTAHRACLMKDGAFGKAGAVVAESVGGLSHSFAANSPVGTHPTYDKTPYGRVYLSIIMGNSRRVGFVV